MNTTKNKAVSAVNILLAGANGWIVLDSTTGNQVNRFATGRALVNWANRKRVNILNSAMLTNRAQLWTA